MDMSHIIILHFGLPLFFLMEAMINEASVDGRDGMLAVAHVINNRSKSDRWPYEYEDIIYQESSNPERPMACHFSYTCDNKEEIVEQKDLQAYFDIVHLANAVIKGESDDITLGADHYVVCGLKPSWIKNMEFTVKIGSHCFYKELERE